MIPVGPLIAAGAVVAGVLVGKWCGPSSAGTVLVVGTVLAVSAVWPSRWRILLVACALACLGAAAMQRALDGLEHSALSDAVEMRARGTIAGELVNDPVVRQYSTQVRVRVGSAFLDGEPRRADRIVFVRATGDVAVRLGVLDAGDRVTLAGGFEPLEGWDRRQRWHHAVGAFRADRLLGFEPPSGPIWRLANELRRRTFAGLSSLPAHERALAGSYLLGDRRGIPAQTIADFRAAGMTHLLVVSGMNVSFAMALCAPLLRRLGLGARFATGIGVLVVFGTMTRWEPSVVRAVVMNGLVMAAVLLGRPSSGPRVLAIAVTVILLVDPFLIHSVGFLLSCSATAGIAVAARPIAARVRGPRWFRDAFSAALAAEIGVAPVLVVVFGHIPLASVPANVLATPPAGVVKLGGLVIGAVGGVLEPHVPEIAALLPLPIHLVLTYERTVAALAARVPIEISGIPSVVLAVSAALVLVLRRARRVRVGGHARPGGVGGAEAGRGVTTGERRRS